MIYITQYINTTGSMKYKTFIESKFNVDLLVQTKNDVDALFDGWNRNDLIECVTFTNNDGIILKFYPSFYEIYITDQSKYTLPMPITIDDFINDMYKFNVNIYWNDIIDKMFEPKEYLHINKIKQYYVDLLSKIDKSYELL